VRLWTGFIVFSIGTCGCVNTVMNLWAQKILGISWVAEQLLASQEGLRSMELVSSFDRVFYALCNDLKLNGVIISGLNWLSIRQLRHSGKWRYGSTFLNLTKRWGWLVSLTPWTLHPRYALDRRLIGPITGLVDVEKRKTLSLPETETRPSKP
jgi:hypothetical protein